MSDFAEMDQFVETEMEQGAAPDVESSDAPAAPVLSISEQAKILEAVLFASPEPLSPQQLRDAVPGDADLGAALGEVQALYQDRGVVLREVDGKWAFRTSDAVAPHLLKFRREEKKLSRAALETMAIIAYHQPITRTEIENIRGVAISKGTLDILMELGWIKPGKRREIPGRPLTWLTTTAFMDHFGLEKLQDLPGMDDLKASGLLDTRPAIETIPDLFGVEDAELEKDAEAGPDERDYIGTDDDRIEADVPAVESEDAASDEDEQAEGQGFVAPQEERDDDSEDEEAYDDGDDDFDDDDDDDDDDFEDDDESEDAR